ncbi:coiled-coil domain-containing protein 63-like [Erpetoichthys calabaricus]|uniref:coiled-coil domain-containing protein 63-like n=1 Tax=Erpetoichthys calabaricus TaxID=27687 RepID=UPI0010A04681|nr:coiled-coil domain-containing protein 63-like [Erpetoichthys calabaricus]
MLARLHQQLVKNDELRKELDNVQIERSIFEQIHLKLEKERQEIRKKISHGIHASTAAYEERVDAQCNLVVLREQNRKKQAQHDIEIENFKRSIDHDKRLKDFMCIKFDTQRVLAMDVFEAGRDEPESCNGQTYEEAFHKIHEITEESDPDVLVRRFMEADDRKIALFSYALEQTREIGRVQEDLEETKEKITLSLNECLHHEEDHQALVTKMKTELAEIQQETDGYRQKAKDMKVMQTQLHKGIDSMVTIIGCDRSGIENRLGNSAGVQSYNMMSYLRLMEQRISELLRIRSYMRLKESEKQYSQRDSSSTLRNQIPKTPQLLIPPSFSIVIQIPSTVEDADTEDRDRLLTDEEVWPLSEEELRERILSMILRREERTSGMNKADVANQPKKHDPGNV